MSVKGEKKTPYERDRFYPPPRTGKNKMAKDEEDRKNKLKKMAR